MNASLVSHYEANILSVIRQLRYSQRSENAIDVALFVNGLPVATAELKNRPTGTTFRHAEKQYRDDRSPAGEPLLTFKRGALVLFAMDEDHVSMTTRLANGKTRFLPFNRGRDDRTGNPDIEGDFRIAYLYADQPEGQAVPSPVRCCSTSSDASSIWNVWNFRPPAVHRKCGKPLIFPRLPAARRRAQAHDARP